MAVITEPILQQNFELAGRQIVQVLNNEIANQKTLQPTRLPEDVNVFFERITAPDPKTEDVVLIVSLDNLNLEYEAQTNGQDTVNYFVDIYANAYQTENTIGDENAGLKLLKYTGLSKHILEHHMLRNLGLPVGAIGGKSISNVQIYEQSNTQDTSFSRQARINLELRINQNYQLWQGIAITQNDTQALLNDTEQGHNLKLN